MKWFITLSIIMFAVAIPLHRAQADNLKPLDFGLLASLIGEWLGKDPEGEPMTASYQGASGGTSPVETLTLAEKPAMTTMYHADKGELMPTHYCALATNRVCAPPCPRATPRRWPSTS